MKKKLYLFSANGAKNVVINRIEGAMKDYYCCSILQVYSAHEENINITLYIYLT